jgi:hypothetical protein
MSYDYEQIVREWFEEWNPFGDSCEDLLSKLE